jgi:hypothetical protein
MFLLILQICVYIKYLIHKLQTLYTPLITYTQATTILVVCCDLINTHTNRFTIMCIRILPSQSIPEVIHYLSPSLVFVCVLLLVVAK